MPWKEFRTDIRKGIDQEKFAENFERMDELRFIGVERGGGGVKPKRLKKKGGLRFQKGEMFAAVKIECKLIVYRRRRCSVNVPITEV